MIITHSSLECFKSCRQKYKLRYIDGIVPKEKSEALEFGSATHLLLEQYFNGLKAVQMFDSDKYEKTLLKDELGRLVNSVNLSKVEKAKLLGLILGYIDTWYEGDFENKEFEVVDVEKEFNKKSEAKNFCFAGKIDAIVKSNSDGRYFIVEHKTSSLVDDAYIAQKDIDSQTLTYAACIEDLFGINVSGVIHDILTKQKIRQKKGESEEEFCARLISDVTPDNFRRFVVEINRDKLNGFKEELEQSCNDLLNCACFYKCTGSCIGRYGTCDYLDLCRAGGLVEAIKEKYETRRPFEEISERTINPSEGEN